MPAGPSHPFATTMQAHFKKLTTPLLSLPQYPTLRSQGRRFLEAGFSEIEVCDLNTFFYGVLDHDSRIAALNKELFDEYEELGAFLGHYFILIARNQSSPPVLRPENHQTWQCINWKNDMLLNGNMKASAHCHKSQSSGTEVCLSSLKDLKPFQRRFSAISSAGGSYLIHGGLSNTTRVSNSVQLAPASASITFTSSPTSPPARMCHTLTKLGSGRVLLIGGRDAPQAALSDVWLFDDQWQRLGDIPGGGIYRHAAVSLSPDKVLLFGGRRNGGQVSSAWYLFDYRKGWEELVCHDCDLALWGASLSCKSNTEGILFGGMDDSGECSGSIFSWSIDEKSMSVALQKWELSPQEAALSRRYGGKLISTSEESAFYIGGAGSRSIISSTEQLLFLDTVSRSVRAVESHSTGSKEPWLIGHDVAQQQESGDIIILGGGGVCFSFGSFWNDEILRLHLGNEDSSSSEGWKLIHESPAPLQAEATTAILSGHATEIERIRVTTREQWHQVLQQSRVTVLEGLDFGSCLSRWTPEYLKQAVGPEKTVVIHSTKADAMNFLSKNFEYSTRSLGTLLDTVFSDSGEKVYLRAVSEDAKSTPARLEDDFPGLANDFILPSVLMGNSGIDPERIHSTVLRVGGVGTSMWLHYDVFSFPELSNSR